MKNIYWAEARINGVLRGGKYNEKNNTFTFHAGLTKIILDNAKKRNQFKILAPIHKKGK